MFVCMYVCMYVCMFFKDILRSRALGESKVVSCCSPVNSTLHRHDITRFPPAVRSWRRAKIVDNLCEVYHFAPFCLVHFPEIRGFAACTCIAQCTTFQVMHYRRALVELYYQCTKFRVAPSKFPESKGAYATQSNAIVLRTMNAINVPNLVSLAQNFLELEDPSRIKFFGPGAFNLHRTRTATGKAYRLGRYTCDLQVWDRQCPSFGLQGRQKNKRCKSLAPAHSTPVH